MSRNKDLKILEGIKTGDSEILQKFYIDNFNYVKGYILENSGNESDVEDVFQDALLIIHQKLKKNPILLSSSFRTYFYSVCKNLWRNKMRKNIRLSFSEEAELDLEESDVSMTEALENNEKESLYQKHFLKLSDTCKELLHMIFEGKKMKEIAATIGYAEGYTRKKKFECKKNLMVMIEKDPIYQELVDTPEKNI